MKKDDQIISAEYAPIFRFFISEVDAFIDFAQPKIGTSDKEPMLVSRVVMPLKAAKDFAKSLSASIEKSEKKQKPKSKK